MPGAGTDKTRNWVGAAGAGRDPGRAADGREHRRGGARHGEFRARRGSAWSSRGEHWANPQARKMASGADRILDEAVDLWHAGGGRRRLHPGAGDHGAGARPGQARGRRRRGPARAPAARSRQPRRSASCSAASASAWRTTRSPRRPDRDAAGQSGLRLAQPRPGVVIVAYEWFKLAGARPAVRRRGRRRRASSSCWRSSIRWSGSWKRSNSSARRQARHHADQPAQYLHPDGADPAGHPHTPRRHHVDRRRPQGSGARRLAQRRRGGAAAHAARRAQPGPGAERARSGARAGAAAAPQSDRGRARLLGRVHARPALRRPRLQAAGPGRAAHRRRGVVPAAAGDRAYSRRRDCGGSRARAPSGAPISPSAAIAWSTWRWRRSRRTSAKVLDGLAASSAVNPSAS